MAQMPTALEHIRPMRGGSQAHLMRADDGHCYVVKFANNPQHPRVLANEWLAGRLAQALGLPVPPMAMIQVPPELVAASPRMVLAARAARKLLKKMAPQVGFEPTTLRLTAGCSTVELLRSEFVVLTKN